MAPHHPQPTTPMESLVVLVKKLSKMAGNSASKPLNSTLNELPCITVEWWRITWKKLCAFSRYTAFNISNRYFSIFVIARIRPLLANPVTYVADRRGSNNEMHCELQPKKTKVCNSVLAIQIIAKSILVLGMVQL